MYGMVGLTVVVGGITRLTGSGLSMVVWQPLIGIVPPVGEAAWQHAFDLYKATPQYLQVNHWMGLADFKTIFFWEYVHRVLARSIGLVCFVPGVWLALRGKLRGRWARMAAAALVLGGLQGALGWAMVKSGLEDVPAVSHLRLAAHLSLAFFVGMWLLWIILDMTRPDLVGARATQASRRGWAVVALLAVQIVYGAFMAGTHAGYLYSTFPDMNGAWIGAGSFAMAPWWRNLLDNPSAIHTIHRWLGLVATIVVVVFALGARRQTRDAGARRTLDLLAVIIVVQLALGALTVVMYVPIAIAVLHQAVAYLLMSAAVAAVHRLRVAGKGGERIVA